MNKRKLFLRILASPFVLCLLTISYTYGMFAQWIMFIRYGGEWITYFEKNENLTIKDIYKEIKDKREIRFKPEDVANFLKGGSNG